MLCECCKKKEAIVKDFRLTESGNYKKFFVCRDCFNLEDKIFFRKLKHSKTLCG